MSLHEDGEEELLDHLVLSDDDFGDLFLDRLLGGDDFGGKFTVVHGGLGHKEPLFSDGFEGTRSIGTFFDGRRNTDSR